MGSKSTKFGACKTKISVPNSTGGSAYTHTTASTEGGGAITWEFTNQPELLQSAREAGKTASANIRLNLQRGNAIYGASDTVQPAGLYAQMLIRAYQA